MLNFKGAVLGPERMVRVKPSTLDSSSRVETETWSGFPAPKKLESLFPTEKTPGDPERLPTSNLNVAEIKIGLQKK